MGTHYHAHGQEEPNWSLMYGRAFTADATCLSLKTTTVPNAELGGV